MSEFSDLRDKVLTKIDKDSDRIYFTCSDGSEYVMYHRQDCCENVYVDDVIGDLDNLLNSPILMAEEITEGGGPTWTFYKLATVKGYVTIVWRGESNGYYSESVSFELNK